MGGQGQATQVSETQAVRPRLARLHFYPHPRRDRLLLSGEITATLRRRTDLKVGDRFQASPLGGWVGEVTGVTQTTVGMAAEVYHAAMGYASRQEFLDDWAKQHPHVGHRLKGDPVWLVRFQKVAAPWGACQDESPAHSTLAGMGAYDA